MDVLPTIKKASSMPLKGGTAINLFYWDMPRLPVDIEFSRYPELLQSYSTVIHTISFLLTQKGPITSISMCVA